MEVIIEKRVDSGGSVYRIKTPAGFVVRCKRACPAVSSRSALASIWDGLVSMTRIAGKNDVLRINTIRDDSVVIRSDWERVGQSIMDGVLVLND